MKWNGLLIAFSALMGWLSYSTNNPVYVAVLVIAITSIMIMYACDSFEEAADFLGRNMKPGTKGRTVNAIGSSLPELFTTSILLFGPHIMPGIYTSKADGFSAGIATCAGSAVFNAVIIPALCILTVMFYGVRQSDGTLQKVTSIELDKRSVLFDGFFFVAAEICLIVFLGDKTITWVAGGSLAVIYFVYMFIALSTGFGGEEEDDDDDDDDDDEDDEEDDEEGVGLLAMGWMFDFNSRFFGGKDLEEESDTGRAWFVLLCATAVIGVACGGVAWAVEASAHGLGVQPYFTAVILAAAATSVPDTVLSMKDAVKGDYDDAVSNAVGSNIFDICICLGLPLLCYGLIFGDITLTASAASADVQILRWVLLVVTGIVLALFLVGKKIGKGKAMVLFSVYFLWTAFVVGRGMEAEWAQQIVTFLP
jgi:cation:H+ antiporter